MSRIFPRPGRDLPAARDVLSISGEKPAPVGWNSGGIFVEFYFPTGGEISERDPESLTLIITLPAAPVVCTATLAGAVGLALTVMAGGIL